MIIQKMKQYKFTIQSKQYLFEDYLLLEIKCV